MYHKLALLHVLQPPSRSPAGDKPSCESLKVELVENAGAVAPETQVGCKRPT